MGFFSSEPEKVRVFFEERYEFDDCTLSRHRIPQGWLITMDYDPITNTSPVTFVPDPNHDWLVEGYKKFEMKG